MASHEQLQAVGVSRHSIQRALTAGLLRQVYPGVYVHAAANFDRRAQIMAAVIAGGQGAVAARRSATWLHGLRDAPLSRPEIVSPASAKPILDGVHVHRTRQLDRVDVCLVDGIPTTTVARTLLDLGASVPFPVVEQAAQDAIIRNRVSAAALAAVLERVRRRGRPGTASLRAIIAQSLPDERLQSELERRLHALIQQAAVPAPDLQYELILPNGKHAFLDFAWPESSTAAEAEGRRWHATRQDFEAGLIRRRQLQDLGWDVRYYGWADVVERSSDVVAELLALPLQPRRSEPRSAA